jgi:hypothetical protein
MQASSSTKAALFEWPPVLHNVEAGGPLRKGVKDDNGSYESMRRVVRAARCS